MLPPLPVDILHVLLLNMAAVEEHGAAEVSRRRGADNLAPETLFHQVRQITRMINVGVRQHHGINAGGIKEEIPVPVCGPRRACPDTGRNRGGDFCRPP